MRELSKSKQLAINLISSIIVFATNMGINFFLSPYIVRHIGVEANGFVTLANNFISYATLLTIALNSMAARFITIKLHQGNQEAACKYYTSVFVGNIVIVIVMLVPAILCIRYLERFINIPSALVLDVKLLFALIFLNFFISTGMPNWSVSFFTTNKLYLQSFCNIVTGILRVVILVGTFSLFTAKVYFVGLAAFAVTLVGQIWAAVFKYKLSPELKIKREYFDFRALVELVMSGIWNSITQLGTLLLSGLDLLIANLFIGPVEMGVLAIAKVVPNAIMSLSNTLANVFNPKLTISYAKKDKKMMLSDLRFGIKVTSALLTIFFAGLLAFGHDFFALWQPTQDANLLQILSILSCTVFIVANPIQCLFNVFSVTNKLKTNSILLLVSGGVNTLIVLFCVRYTNFGLFAVAGVSGIVGLIRHLVYTVPYTAIYLDMKWTTFYPDVLRSALITMVDIAIGLGINYMIPIQSWIGFILIGGIYAVVAILTNCYIVLNKKERKLVLAKMLAPIKRNRI